jgi:membrane protein
MDRVRTAWTVVRRAIQEARDDDVATMAQALAYALFLAIPATALVVLGVFSLVADPEAVTRVVDAARDVMPAEAAALLEDSLRRSTQSAGGGLLMTIVGFALAVWSTTSAASTLMTGITRAYDADDERSFVRKRLVALLIVCALVLGAALVVIFLVLGPHLERWLGSTLEAESVTAWVWWTLQWPILLGGLLFAFATVLYLGPDVQQRTWKLVTPGALTAVLIWLVASGGFAFYTANFGSYNKSWGALSAVVITLVWLWLTSASLLFGAEINAEAERVREAKGKTESDAAVLEVG